MSLMVGIIAIIRKISGSAQGVLVKYGVARP